MAGFAALCVVVAIVAAIPIRRPLLPNGSASLPRGLYEVRPVDRPIAAGDTVVICPPLSMATIAAQRHYMEAGPCPGKVAALLKLVAAVSGDVIDLSPTSLSVNGRCLEPGASLVRDRLNRALPHVRAGRYRLGAHQIWLWGPNPRSLDSRYFGPLDARDVSSFAQPLLVWPGPAHLGFANPPCS